MNKKKILIVDDGPQVRAGLAREFKALGYQVFQAGNGEEGFKLAQKSKPDIVISSMSLPRMDGNELFRKLCMTDFGREIPFIVLPVKKSGRYSFEIKELIADVERNLKRKKPGNPPGETKSHRNEDSKEESKPEEQPDRLKESPAREELRHLNKGEAETENQVLRSINDELKKQPDPVLTDGAVTWSEVPSSDPDALEEVPAAGSSKWVFLFYGAAVVIFVLIHMINRYWLKGQ